MKISIAGKGGTGKTPLTAALARELAACGLRVLAVDCDPNPNLAEEFGLQSDALERFDHSGLRPVPGTLELAREPRFLDVDAGISLLGGPPSEEPLADAVARGIAGVLLAPRFDCVVTDLGAGPEFAEMAVGGVLNPAEICVVLQPDSPAGRLSAERIEAACRRRAVPVLLVSVPADAGEVAARLLDEASPHHP